MWQDTPPGADPIRLTTFGDLFFFFLAPAPRPTGDPPRATAGAPATGRAPPRRPARRWGPARARRRRDRVGDGVAAAVGWCRPARAAPRPSPAGHRPHGGGGGGRPPRAAACRCCGRPRAPAPDQWGRPHPRGASLPPRPRRGTGGGVGRARCVAPLRCGGAPPARGARPTPAGRPAVV